MGIKVVIDETEIEATEGRTILEAALGADVYIPHLCYHLDLPSLFGISDCAQCLVVLSIPMVNNCYSILVWCRRPISSANRASWDPSSRGMAFRHNSDFDHKQYSFFIFSQNENCSSSDYD